MRLLTSILLIGFISGCANPKVVYNRLNDLEEDFDGKIKFQLTDSILTFEHPKDSEGNPDNTKISMTSTALPDTRTTYTVEGAPWYQNWFCSTDLTATHAEGNPLLLTQMGTSMTDQAIPVLKAIGTVAAVAVAIVGAMPQPPSLPTIPLPVGIKISELLKNLPDDFKDKCHSEGANGETLPQLNRDTKIICRDLALILPKVDSNGKSNDSMQGTLTADITMGAIPSGALLVSKRNGKENITFPFTSKTMIYSACRPMQITLKFEDKRTKESVISTILDTSVVVADSDWVQTIALPSKGSVKFSGSCGADSIPSDFAAKIPILDQLSQAVQSAQSVSDALKKETTGKTSGLTK